MSRRFYLVTGGLGFIGAPLSRALLAAGHRVRILDNLSRGSREKLGAGATDAEILEGDIRDPGVVARAIAGVDSVFHLAFVNGTESFYTRPAYVLDVGVKGMLNVIDGCLRHGTRELFLASSSEVYQTPPAVPTDERVPLSIPDPLVARYSYAGGKIVSELLAINYGRESFDRVVIFRPHNAYGPDAGWDHVIPQFITRLRRLRGELGHDAELPFSIQGTGDQTRAFVHVDDLVAGVMALVAKGEHLNVYNVGTTEEIRIADLAQRIARLTGSRIRLVPGPPAEGGTQRRCPDIRKLQALGYAPRVSFDEGLADTVRWYLARLGPLERR